MLEEREYIVLRFVPSSLGRHLKKNLDHEPKDRQQLGKEEGGKFKIEKHTFIFDLVNNSTGKVGKLENRIIF